MPASRIKFRGATYVLAMDEDDLYDEQEGDKNEARRALKNVSLAGFIQDKLTDMLLKKDRYGQYDLGQEGDLAEIIGNIVGDEPDQNNFPDYAAYERGYKHWEARWENVADMILNAVLEKLTNAMYRD